ncbi:UNVERIFIED_CONTAM: hypothetical protein FKN15_043956 [Acipenser sinensis]
MLEPGTPLLPTPQRFTLTGERNLPRRPIKSDLETTATSEASLLMENMRLTAPADAERPLRHAERDQTLRSTVRARERTYSNETRPLHGGGESRLQLQMEGGGPQPVSLPQPPAPLHGPVPKLPRYNGVMSLEAFLTQFELVAEVARRLPACLSHWRVLQQSESPYRLQDQLWGRCRATGEKQGALAADIARLSCKAYRDEPTSFSQRIALDTFLRSLQPPELRHQVRLKRPSTLKEALGYAQSIEEVLLDEEPLPRHLTSKPVRLVEHMWRDTEGQSEVEHMWRDTEGTDSEPEPTPVQLKTVTGEQAPVEGRGQLRVTYAGLTFRHKVWLAAVQDGCILGLDFLRRAGISLDLRHGHITTFAEPGLALPALGESTKSGGVASYAQTALQLMSAAAEVLPTEPPLLTGHSGLAFSSPLLYTGRVAPNPTALETYPNCTFGPYTPMKGAQSNVWFDRYKISNDCPEHLESIDSMCKVLGDLVDVEVKAGVSKNRILIGGFSMGGAMALHLAFRFHPQVAGVFALSSFLNKDSIVYQVN